MPEAHEISMQGLSAKGFQCSSGRGREHIRLGLESGAVNVVAEKGVSYGGEMDADLVGASRLQSAGEKACNRHPLGAGIAFEHLPMGDRFATAFPHGHPFPRVRAARDR